MSTTDDPREALSSPSRGLVAFYAVQPGEAIETPDGAAIVVTSTFISADAAEDFDWFDISERGGAWEVTIREPATDEERDACDEILQRILKARLAAEAEINAEELRHAAHKKAREELAGWCEELLESLIHCSSTPDSMRSAVEKIAPAKSFDTGHDAGATNFYRIPGGWLCKYGSVATGYVDKATADEWYLARWNHLTDNFTPARIAKATLCTVLQQRDWFGADLDRWAFDHFGQDTLIAMAQSAGPIRLPERVNSHERDVETLKSIGVDARLLPQVWLTNFECEYIDPVDGSKWKTARDLADLVLKK